MEESVMKQLIVRAALTIAFAISAFALVDRASAAGTLPVYPGSVLMSTQPGATKICGRVLTMKMYSAATGASVASIVDWYQKRLSGGTRLDISAAGAGRSAEVFAAGGAYAVAISALSSSTIITLEHFDPPYSRSQIALMVRAELHGDAAARAQAKALFHCNDDN
jgi:hypothetical protein